MPRVARRVSPTNYYHIMMRGNNRERIFSGSEDKQLFLNLLRKESQRQSIGIASYCVMDNHVHLLVEADLTALSRILKRLNIIYAIYYNSKKQRVGHVFQDRFKSQMITDEVYLLRCMRYIHNNPVKAQLVKTPEGYPYSSFQEYTRIAKVLSSSQKTRVLEFFGHSVKSFMEFHGEQDEDIYLDMPDVMKQDMIDKGRKIIETHLINSGITEIIQATSKKTVLEAIVHDLLLCTNLSQNEIKELLGVSAYIVKKVKIKLGN